MDDTRDRRAEQGYGNDLYDRMARAEQNHLNSKENFQSFKTEIQDQFQSLSKKMDELMDTVTGIRMVIAKWLGAGAVVIFIGQLLIDRVFAP